MNADRGDFVLPWADVAARSVGLPDDWREQGFDTPEYMRSDDSLYHVRGADDRPTGVYKCVWPGCTYRHESLRAIFRHVHGSTHKQSYPPAGEGS